MKINAIDESGKLKEYDVILTYHSDDYNKDYIVYTDNIYNSYNELQIYINEYNHNDVEATVKDISDNGEYSKIKKEIDNILVTMKNEKDKFN